MKNLLYRRDDVPRGHSRRQDRYPPHVPSHLPIQTLPNASVWGAWSECSLRDYILLSHSLSMHPYTKRTLLHHFVTPRRASLADDV